MMQKIKKVLISGVGNLKSEYQKVDFYLDFMALSMIMK